MSKIYLQMYTLHTLKNDYYLQLVFCFLPSKDICNYEDMCRTLINRQLAFKNFKIDFEIAAHISVVQNFGCTDFITVTLIYHTQIVLKLLKHYFCFK